tara:strand:+ start:474 stop:1217 length:744 start_codon:yes stop_codon:yes gene_type:complete
MDIKEIKGIQHFLYDSIDEFKIHNPSITVKNNWRNGQENEWVFTDDKYVCQILRKFTMKDKPCVRTVCGTFITTAYTRDMLGDYGIADNIYTFSGKHNQTLCRKNKVNGKGQLFAQYVASGVDAISAYKMTYPNAKSETHIKNSVNKLLKQTEVQTMVKEEIQKILKEEECDPGYIIGRFKTIADLSENDSSKLRALESLAKISGLFDTQETKQEQLTVWAGFSPEQLEAINSTGTKKLIAKAEKEG